MTKFILKKVKSLRLADWAKPLLGWKQLTTARPPLLRMEGPKGLVVYPAMKKMTNGSWEIANPEGLKKILKMDPSGLI